MNRLLNRRQTLALFKAIATAVLVGCIPRRSDSMQVARDATTANPARTPACVLRPQQTEGPYFIDEKLNRADIRVDLDGTTREGVPLQLTLRVLQIGSACTPLADATVDIWHCDAMGSYSGVSNSNADENFLRGYQVTDASGVVQFTTIYPGWYPGRTVHFHLKIRTKAAEQNYEFTSQLYFDDAITDQVHAQKPYASNGQRRVTNAEDGIFRDGGDQLLLALTETSQGYAATLDIGLEII